MYSDCTTKNLMMDGDTLFPRGFHPVHTNYLEDTNTRAPVVSRLAAWPPVKYYYVDFGIAVQIPPHVYPKLALGEDGLDREVPELSNVRPYDPFKVDIFILGNVYRKNIYAVILLCMPENVELTSGSRNSQTSTSCIPS